MNGRVIESRDQMRRLGELGRSIRANPPSTYRLDSKPERRGGQHPRAERLAARSDFMDLADEIRREHDAAWDELNPADWEVMA